MQGKANLSAARMASHEAGERVGRCFVRAFDC